MKLIYIRSTMEPKNYSTIRSILKKEQGEKIAPYIFKLADTKSLQTYLVKERITRDGKLHEIPKFHAHDAHYTHRAHFMQCIFFFKFHQKTKYIFNTTLHYFLSNCFIFINTLTSALSPPTFTSSSMIVISILSLLSFFGTF